MSQQQPRIQTLFLFCLHSTLHMSMSSFTVSDLLMHNRNIPLCWAVDIFFSAFFL
jgi:hypothetical protein